jgi:D-alanyl-D-alanine carboxypeptidase
LGHGLRKVVRGNQGFTGNVLGLTQREADLACARLQSRGVQCFTMGLPEETLNGG